MSVPVAAERKSYLPLRLRPTSIVGQSPTAAPMPSVSETNDKSSLTVGNRVLVNGLKSGTLWYIGPVQFAQGLFCGVELDQPEGKHDGEVKDIRYFQCKPNHGIFVPRDKVVPEPRTRTSASQKPTSRLKPPTVTRSISLTPTINRVDQSKSVQLPDIVPNSIPQPVTLNESIINDDQEILLSIPQVKEEPKNLIEPHHSLPIDESPEAIEADFTDSVSLILHQLQQEEKLVRNSSSITISEEETDDDDEDDIDTESVVESIIDQPPQSSASSIVIPVDLTKSIQTDLSFHANDKISFTKDEVTTPTNKKKSIVQPVKKNVEKRPSTTPAIQAKRPMTRKPAIVPAKKNSITKTQLNTTSSKLSLSPSSCNSLNSSQSDVASVNKTPKQISDKSQMINNIPSACSEIKHDESHDHLMTLNRSLEANNQRLRTYYRHLLNQFDLITIVAQYHLNENDKIKQQHQLQLSKARTTHDQLQHSIEQIQSSHKTELSSINNQHQNQIEILHKTHEQQLNEFQQKTDQLLREKTELESRCLVLQEKVDGFLAEMANSEHADMLLCHVETLEKDRTSLQTVLEFKHKEVTQLRTKLNEQQIKLTDELALQKRITMAENRIQDLEWLLREKQLSEKTAVIERDELKERNSQLERDNCQLQFENETLRYRLLERSSSISMLNDKPIESIPIPIPPPPAPPRKKRIRYRSLSLSSLINSRHENERMKRSLSLNR